MVRFACASSSIVLRLSWRQSLVSSLRFRRRSFSRSRIRLAKKATGRDNSGNSLYVGDVQQWIAFEEHGIRVFALRNRPKLIALTEEFGRVPA